MCETNIGAMFTMLPLFTLTTARSLCFAPSKVQPDAFLEEWKGGAGSGHRCATGYPDGKKPRHLLNFFSKGTEANRKKSLE